MPPETEVSTAAAHIVQMLDAVTVQLAEIRKTADRMSRLQEGDEDAPDA